MMPTYPFKFLDYYTVKDTKIFFGREDETKILHEIIYQTNILLIYGASGTGKTSLILCGLAKKLKPYDWLPIVVRRGDNINESLKKLLNDYAGSPVISNADVPEAVRSIYNHHFKPVYLIFDQFEELYIRGSAEEHAVFVKTVQDLAKDLESVKIILAIREEYLGNLYPFEKKVPQLMQKRVRVESMNLGKVREVLLGINQLPGSVFKLEPKNEETIIQTIFDIVKGDSVSLTIELTYFQVFMDKLYMKIAKDETHQKTIVCTNDDVLGMGKIGDVLTKFLDDQVNDIVTTLDNSAVTAEVLWKMLSRFVTSEGTKEPIPDKGLEEKLRDFPSDIIGVIIERFRRAQILRFSDEDRTWEVAHDSLAARIEEKRTDEERARVQIRAMIDSQLNLKATARGLLSENQLHFIDTYKNKVELNNDEQDLIKRSKHEVKRSLRTRRLSQILQIGLIILLAAGIAGGYLFLRSLKKSFGEKEQLMNEKAQLNYENSLKDYNGHLTAAKSEFELGKYEQAIGSINAAIAVKENYKEVMAGTDFRIKTLDGIDTLVRFRENIEKQRELEKLVEKVRAEILHAKELERANEARTLKGFHEAGVQYSAAESILETIPNARDYHRLKKELNEAQALLQERMQNSLDRLIERVSKFVSEPEGHAQAKKLLAEAEEFMPSDSRILDYKTKLK